MSKNTVLKARIAEAIERGTLGSDDPPEVYAECAQRYVRDGNRKLRNERRRKVEKAAIVGPFAESFADEVESILANYEIRWTKELLAETFDVDGISVGYGVATVNQHSRYADMVLDIAHGSLRTVAIHRRAITDIIAAGVTCLEELPQ